MYASTAPRQLMATLVAVALLLAALLTAVPAPRAAAAPSARVASAATTTAAPAADPAGTSSAHPYGDPIWFPLRTRSSVGCAKTACGAYAAHDYWAIDFTGQLDDPVYAAGAGILHIGGRGSGCSPKGSTEDRGGNWVWIDHGAGVVSRYHHLNTITVTEGQLVTPTSQIGTMGHSGDNEPCLINYLHFEVRHGGYKGERVDPGELNICTPEGRVTMPAALGGTDWDDPAIHTRPRIRTLAGDHSCITSDWQQTPNRTTVALTRGAGSAIATWPAPAAGATAVHVGLETYRPSVKEWRGPVWVTLPATATSYRFTGLDNGRPYRVTVSVRNANGTAVASASSAATPADRPAAPGGPRYADWNKRDSLRYGWTRPAHNGSHVTRFTVAWRCTTGDRALPTTWSTAGQGDTDTYRNVRGLSRFDRCQVKVRATNDVGAGAWSATSTLRWRA